MNQVYHLFLTESGKRPGFARVLWKALSFVIVFSFGASMATAQQQLYVSTDTISAVVQSGGTAGVSFNITNSGDAPLVIDSYTERNAYGTAKSVVFTKANYANWLLPANQDRIAPHVWLTRDETKSLFNAKSEVASETSSPEGTSWALGTVNEVSPGDFTTFNTMHGNDPQSLVGDTATLKIDFANGSSSKYYSIYMQQWSGGKTGGGFTYIRKEMLPFYNLTASYTGEILAGNTESVSILLSDAGLESGTHYGHVDIASNDPGQPVTTVVVKLEVLPVPQIELSESTISVSMDNAEGPIERTFTIFNTGGSTLNWNGSTSTNTQGMCASFSALSGSIEAGASAEYTITFAVCNEGTYQWPFVITSNDTGRPNVTLQLTAVVDGSPELDYTTPVFVETYTGASSTGTLILHSTGTADLHITDISSDNPVFSPTRKTLTIKPGASVSVPVKFIPKSAGSHSGQLLIVSDHEEDSLYVDLFASAVGAPVLSISPSSLAFDMSHGESTKDSLAIFNNGTSDLEWDFSVTGAVSSAGSFFEKKDHADISLSQNRDRLTPNVELARDDEGGIYNYLSAPIMYTLGSTKDNNSTKYKSDFRSGVNSSASDLPGQILSIYIPSEERYFDLHIDSWTCCGAGGGLSYTRYEVFKWINPEYKSNPELEVFFEKPENVNTSLPEYRDSLTENVSLVRNFYSNMGNYNGSPEIRYALGSARYLSAEDYVSYFPNAVGNASELPGKTVSIYIPAEDRYFDLDFITWSADNYSNYTPGGYSYVRREILPTSTAAGMTDYAVINVNGNMPAGTYSGSVTVESNDPLLPSAVVPITITTTGTPDISETDQTYDFGSTVQGVAKTFEVRIRNSGSDVLEIASVAIDNSSFEVSSDGISIPAGSSHKLPVTVHSSVVGPIVATLTLTTNDSEHSEYTIEVSGLILDVPVFAMNDVIFYDTLAFGSSSVQQLSIQNNGLGQMEWAVAYDVYFEKEDFALTTDASAQDRITDHVWLTRANERGLFNILEADEYTRVAETFEWGNEASTYESTEYSYFTDFWDGGDLMNNAKISMHMIPDDLYYDFHFTSWTSGEGLGGGGFAYERRAGVRWLGLGAYEGVVEAGASVDVPLYFSAANTTAGDHEFTYRIATNDPNNPEQLVTFKLHVDGEPEIEVAMDPLDFGSFPIGKTHTVESAIEINNLGGADLEITLSTDNEVFSFETSSFVIPGGTSKAIYSRFTPETETIYEGTITISSNDADEPVLNLAVSAEGFYGPEVTVSADTIAATMISGGLVKKTVTLSNTGGTNLEWSLWSGFFMKEELADYKLEANQLHLSDKVWITRNGYNGPFNIKETSNYTYNPSSVKWALGATEDLLSTAYSADWNSLVYSLSHNFNNLPGKVVSLYMVEEGRYFDFLFTNYTNNGAMGFYYAEVGGISPNEGEILPGEAEVVELSLSAEGLDAGVHYQEFTLFHNGLAPSKKLVGKITVLGAPALSVAEESLAFGVAPIGDKSYQEISITNSGSASGVVSLASDHPAFTVDSESVRIKANETKTVAVAFNPPSSGDFSGLITITTDDAANPSFVVGVSGSGATAATISVVKPNLNASLFLGETITRSFTISNSGDFDLSWSLGTYGEEISFVKPDYADYKLEAFQDRVSDHLWITRQNERGIFNIALETQYNRSNYESPKGTEWLGDGSAIPGPFITVSANEYGKWRDVAYPPNEQPGRTFSMHDIKSDQYYDISWDSWTEDGNGGGFSYRRKVAFGPEYNAVSFSDTEGVIAPGKTVTVLVTYNPNSSYDGDFELPLAILSNDPANREVRTPISLSVKGIIVDRFLEDLQLNEGFGTLSIDVSDVFVDAQGDVLSLSVSNSDETAIAATILDGNLVLTETGYGHSLITLTARDATGNTATEKFEIDVNANPVVTPLEDVELTRSSEVFTLDIAANFEDPEGQGLSYAMINGSDVVAEVSLTGTVLSITQLSVGTSMVSLTVTDPLGGSVTEEFAVNVSALHQEITFDTTYVKVYGDGAFELVAFASSGLDVSFVSSNEDIVTIDGTVATVVSAGSVTITATQVGDDVYVAAEEVQNVLTIGKATLEVTVEDASITYGESEPVYTLSYTGFVNDDDLTDIATPGSGAVASALVTNAGTYTLLANEDAEDNNYAFTYTSGTLTVHQASLMITADDVSKVYGDENPPLTVSYQGFVKDEDETVLNSPVVVLSAASVESSVGAYPITASGATAANYQITYTDGLLTISSKELTVSAIDQVKVYGESDPELTYAITAGDLVGEDVLTGALVRESGENVGSYAINQGTLLAGANYELHFEEADLTIEQAILTVTADAKTKVYGESDPELTYSISGGELIGEDVLSGALTRAAGENAGVYLIGLGSVSAGVNYDLQYESAELTITKAPLTVIADAKTKVYGESDPELTYSISGGELIGEDVLSGALARAAGENAGVYLISLGSVSAGVNYELQYESAELTIDKAPLTVAADAKTKVYGESDPELTYSISGGELIGEDVLSGALTRVAGENAGVYLISLGSISAGVNYDLQYESAELTIGKATLTVTANDVVITEGDLIPALTVTYSGFVNGDTKADLHKEPVASTTATPSSMPGSYPIVLVAEMDHNYSFVLLNGTLTIEAGEPILGVERAELIEVYPNPAVNFVMVKSSESKPLELYDAVGHLVRSGVTNQQLEIGELPAGMYLIKVEGQVFRLVKK
ncbi:MBG domain-containing protein [Marinoscillum luteum]|uniref:MBG domain-containing protein n=1 Tax=Marinoscillum luteum TaxID=861051 RepID=A0ABW7NEA7_9BACT